VAPVAGAGFGRFLDADPERLHAAAHSHHPWPDASLDGQVRAWDDAARLMDRKWAHVFDTVVPETQAWIAHRLALPAPATVAVAPNTHELFMRILSCLDPPVAVLTTDGEFSSFERQIRRLAEDGVVHVERVGVAPLHTLPDRLVAAVARGGHDLVFFSHVLFGSGAVAGDLTAIVDAVPDDDTFVVVDGYHGFMAVPTDLSAIADRAFYLAGGYKYAMAGEGVCFAHCPPGYGPRPRDTGWFADFAALEEGADRPVRYGPDGQRFLGATFDPTALYRFNAVQRWLTDAGWTVEAIHDHVTDLQHRFLAGLTAGGGVPLRAAGLVASPVDGPHGHLLAFEHPQASAVATALAGRNVIVDHRGTRLRVGLGIYHDTGDIDELLERFSGLPVPGAGQGGRSC
jgi:selenocysteine lyase/cysteine desulfurase